MQRKEIIIIVTYLMKSLGIGYYKNFPWKNIPSLKKKFGIRTMGHIIIIGHNTWEKSYRRSGLFKKRTIIILSTTLKQRDVPAGILISKNLTDALRVAQALPDPSKKIFIAGGEEVFKKVMTDNLANTIEANVIHDDLLEHTVIFPKIGSHWKNIEQGPVVTDFDSQMNIQSLKLKNTRNTFWGK